MVPVSLRELVTMFEYSECVVHLFTSVVTRSGNILFLFPHVHCSKISYNQSSSDLQEWYFLPKSLSVSVSCHVFC